MYCKYVTTSTPTVANVISDIAKLISGSALNALSASCDQGNSVLTSTVAPGWTLFDNAAPTNGQVLSCSDADALTTKYCLLNGSSTFNVTAYETWNASSHTGTNASSQPAAMTAVNTSAVNTYYVFATPRGFYIADSAGTTIIGCGEISRDVGYLSGSTYPCHFVGGHTSFTNTTANSIFFPRMKTLNASGDWTGGSASASPGGIYGRDVAQHLQNGTVRDASNNQYHVISPVFLISNFGAGSLVVTLGKVYDWYETSYGFGSTLDTVSDGTDTYVVLASTTVQRMALKQK